MNEENEWDQNVKAELLEGLVERVSQEEVVKAIREMKVGKAAGPSKVIVEMIAASGEIGISVMVELCQDVLNGRGMPEECCGTNFQGERGCSELKCIKGSEVAKVCNEDSRKGAREEIVAYGESGQDAIWFYARQRNDRCSVHSEEVTRGVFRQGEEVVYVLH